MYLKLLINTLFVILVFDYSGYSQKSNIDSNITNSSKPKIILYGQASYYAQKFHGRKTASGEKFSHSKNTAACNALPLGTLVKVTNLKNGNSVILTVNDRLHKKTKRILDVGYTTAQKLGFVKAGLTRVKIEVLNKP